MIRTTRRDVVVGLVGVALVLGFGRRLAEASGIRRLRKWQCTYQDCVPYIYDPSVGDINLIDEDNPIPPGVAFEDLPENWICPECGDPKDHFVPINDWVVVDIRS